jgi:hypothetical protein
MSIKTRNKAGFGQRLFHPALQRQSAATDNRTAATTDN